MLKTIFKIVTGEKIEEAERNHLACLDRLLEEAADISSRTSAQASEIADLRLEMEQTVERSRQHVP